MIGRHFHMNMKVQAGTCKDNNNSKCRAVLGHRSCWVSGGGGGSRSRSEPWLGSKERSPRKL